MRAFGRHGARGKPKPGSPGRASTPKRRMPSAVPERRRLPRTGLSDAAKAGEPAYPVGTKGLTRGSAPSTPRRPRADARKIAGDEFAAMADRRFANRRRTAIGAIGGTRF